MAAEFHRKTKLIQPRGFYFEKKEIFSSTQTAQHVIRALMGEDLDNLSTADVSNRAVQKLEVLFSACLAKEVLFRAVRDSPLFWDTIAHDFEGYFVLTPKEVRETVGTYAQGRHVYRGNLAATTLNRLADQWSQVVQETNSLPPPASFNLAWRPGASGVFIELAQAMKSVSLNQSATWPPVHFTPEEVMILTSTAEFRQELYAIASTTQGQPRALPVALTQAMEVRKFLCWVALAGTPSNSAKALYPTPVAYLDRDMRQSWYRATGNKAMVYFNLDRFLEYATDAFTNRRKTSVTCLFTPWMLGLAPASDLQDSIGDQFWSHPRMLRYGSTITIRLIQQTQQGMTKTGLEFVQFDPWLRYREQLKSKFAGHQMKMMQLNREVTEKLGNWAGSLGGGFPIIGRWWGGNRVGGVEDDAVNMAAAFCLKLMRDGDLPMENQQLQALGFVNTKEF